MYNEFNFLYIMYMEKFWIKNTFFLIEDVENLII